MPSAHRLIEESARAAWHQAMALRRAARADLGTLRADLDAFADYVSEQRDGWLRASELTRREEGRRRADADSVAATFAALDYGADDFGPAGPGDDDFGSASHDDFGFDVPGDR